MTRYMVLVSAELVEEAGSVEAMNWPSHMHVANVSPLDLLDGLYRVEIDDEQAPAHLDGWLIEPYFTKHEGGRVTVDYGSSVRRYR